MKVLSLFDGIACGREALRRLGIDVERYVAYEIEQSAINIALNNFPEIEERGDVFKADFTEFKGFDLLIGGSPCTLWSIAKAGHGRETSNSGLGWELFSQYIRAWKESGFRIICTKTMRPCPRKSAKRFRKRLDTNRLKSIRRWSPRRRESACTGRTSLGLVYQKTKG